MKVKSLIKIFVVKDCKLYMLPDEYIDVCDEIDQLNQEYVKKLKIENINLKQCYTFVKKENSILDITIMYVDIINYKSIIGEYELLELDNSNYTIKAKEYIMTILGRYNTLKKIYKDEFTIPEVQKLFEYTYNIKYDRRNFRKKMLKSKCVVELDEFGKYCKGRPAKAYKFESKEDRVVL